VSSTLKKGKLPHRPDPRDLKLADYLDNTSLPTPPETFGHADLISEDAWGMLGNDSVGDCVFAGAAHETLALAAEGGHHPTFTDQAVLSDYSAVTGYVPGDPSTDRGTDVRNAVKYRKQTGIVDAAGHRHHIGAYLYLNPGDVDQLFQALYIFGAVGVGYELPESAEQQFSEGKPWDVVSGSAIAGGHYVPAFGRRSGGFIDAVSWGKRIAITPAFYEKYADEAVVYISASALSAEGTTPEGFDKAALVGDLAMLKTAVKTNGTTQSEPSVSVLFPEEPTFPVRPLNPLRDPIAA
jgi:hypothetical protein